MRVLYGLGEGGSKKESGKGRMRSHADAAIGRGESDLNGAERTSEQATRTLSQQQHTLRHELWLTGRWVVEGAKGLIALLIPQTQSRPLSGRHPSTSRFVASIHVFLINRLIAMHSA